MIKVHYDQETNFVLGYYPDSVNYGSIPTPNIGIEDENQILDKIMHVIDGVYQEYHKPEAELLSQAKLDKIAQLKKNRDIANIAPMVSHQAKEITFDEVEDDFVVTNNDVYFKFKLDPTGFSQTESTTICIAVIMTGAVNPAYFLRYSCEIIEGENIRKGYVAITPQVAGSIMTHGSERITNNTSFCNNLETQISAIEIIENEDPEIAVTYEQAIEALNNIDITF